MLKTQLMSKVRKFPIGTSSFEELVARENNEFTHYFVDKTLFIQDVLNTSGKVLLFPRPRRFGKSMNLDMLRCFFDIQQASQNRLLFKGLKIESAILTNKQSCLDYQGQYPVIYMDFKKLCQSTYPTMFGMFKTLVYDIYSEHRYLLRSQKLERDQYLIIDNFLNQKADETVYKDALKYLMQFLSIHSGNKKVIVLIDEYDVPFQEAIYQDKQSTTENGSFLTEVKNLFSVFLGDALKGNDKYLEKCIMTGVVRIAGAGIFSQLNNLNVWTILDNRFTDTFGFTENELIGLLKDVNKSDELERLREWYNGYKFGDNIIYNPWSVMNYLDRAVYRTYWLDTSDNKLLRDSLLKARNIQEEREINEAVAILVSQKTIQKTLNTNLIFDNRLESIEHLWILLLSTGYLKPIAVAESNDNRLNCTLAIPNREVRSIYTLIFQDWLAHKGIKDNSPLIEYLLKGQAPEFCKELERFFKAVVSVRDTAEKKLKSSKETKTAKEDESYEAYYHGFMVGILGLSLNANHHEVMLTSNRESGYGFYDLLLEPKDPYHKFYHQAIMFEFKHAEEEAKLEKSTVEALKQIKTKEYSTNLIERGIKEIVLIGVAFHKKQIKYKYETLKTDSLKYSSVKVNSSLLSSMQTTTTVSSSHATSIPAIPLATKKSLTDFFGKKTSATTSSISTEPPAKKAKLNPTVSSLETQSQEVLEATSTTQTTQNPTLKKLNQN